MTDQPGMTFIRSMPMAPVPGRSLLLRIRLPISMSATQQHREDLVNSRNLNSIMAVPNWKVRHSVPNSIIVGLEWENVFDGDVVAMWHGVYQGPGAHLGPSNYVGLSLTGCATTCIKPEIIRKAGSTVCASVNQSVTLIATSSSGTITWFRDGTQVATGDTLTTTTPGSYTAKTVLGSCTSAASDALVVALATGCSPVNCVLNKVRLKWRSADFNRVEWCQDTGIGRRVCVGGFVYNQCQCHR